MHTLQIKLNNLTCEACVKLSKKRLESIAGVKEVFLDNVEGNAEIISQRQLDLEELQKALEGTEYRVSLR